MAYVYPYKKHNYIVLIDSKEVGGFSEVNAGDITIDPIEYREGINPVNTVLKQPGLVKYGNVTLKWGLATATELMTWLQSTVDGTCERKTITIQLCDDLHKVVAEWEVINAWPTKYTPTDFNATSNEIAIESVELAHEGIKRIKP